MDASVHSPTSGTAGALTPALVKSKYFEFFPGGTHREALLLGELVEQYVHRIRSKGYNVLCGSRAGRCDLCERAAESDDIGVQRSEYYAAGFVRVWREKMFEQKVVVFSTAAAEQILRLIPEGSARGSRLEVVRYSHGSSSRFKISLLQGLPAGFPAVLPAAYDVIPFIRARYGKPAHPTQTMVFLAPFRCERSNMALVGRPKPLGLSVEDCAPDLAELDKVREKLAQWKEQIAATTPTPPAAPAATPVVTPPADPVPAPAALVPPPVVTPPVAPATAPDVPLPPPVIAPPGKIVLVPIAVPISNPAGEERMAAMRRQSEQARAVAATGSVRLTSIDTDLGTVEAGILARASGAKPNGKHPTKKGGAN